MLTFEDWLRINHKHISKTANDFDLVTELDFTDFATHEYGQYKTEIIRNMANIRKELAQQTPVDEPQFNKIQAIYDATIAYETYL